MDIKPDERAAKERLRQWWTGGSIDRVAAMVKAPRRGVSRRPLGDRIPDKYIDEPTVLGNVEATVEATYYGGDALPMHWVYLGPIPLSGYMGCEMVFEPRTVWHPRRFETWDAVETLAFDPDNRWYGCLRDLTRASLRQAAGRYLVSGQGFGCVSDVVADLWGSEATLMAMLERPDAVRQAVNTLVEISKRCYDDIDRLTAPHQEGSFDWLYLWAPGRMWTLQSDLCCMISPAAFREFVEPELRAEAESVDYSFYHLDGPGAIRHLDALLGIEALDGIQWVPGAGVSNDPMDWIDLFRRIQDAGKKVLVYCPPNRVRPLLDRISRRDVCLDIHCEDQDAAERLLIELDRIGV